METQYVLTQYLDAAMAEAEYDKLDENSFGGRIPACRGVVAFGESLRACQETLRSTLEDWLLVGLKLGHELPVVGGIDLNTDPAHEQVDPV